MRKALILTAGLSSVGLVGAPTPADACGGFFCGQTPVDQNAERVIFSIDAEREETTMIVQIAYQGASEDFAWIVPLADVPVMDSLGTFPQAALTALDANSAPQVWQEYPCAFAAEDSAGPPMAGSGPRDEDGVTVHIEEEVGPYGVAVIESDDAGALLAWLRTHEYRVTTPMEPYIAEYTAAGMKFLALRLSSGADVSQIEPFKLVLPGTSPSIPLRMTALAAEPEMGIVVFILGDQRYEGANWPNVEVPSDYLVSDLRTGQHNWVAAVARVVDEAGGIGWVTETATPLESYLQRLMVSTPADPEQAAAIEALLGIMEGRTYISRLYTRVSAEEMQSDPIFRRSDGADVERWRSIPWAGEPNDCSVFDDPELAPSPCAFIACGAGGTCGEVVREDGTITAGCACVPGATARTTLDPNGQATVACQDMRMSFLNPGDRETPDSAPLPDPCVGFDCGEGGSCVPMNMTPTCVCGRGQVAIGAIDASGGRSTTCVETRTPLPESFYNGRLPELPSTLSPGRLVEIEPPMADVSGGGGCAVGAVGGSSAPVSMVVLGCCLAVLRRRRG